MRKVLILTPFFPPFPRAGTTRRVVNFARYLPELGWEPVILTMNWGYEDHRYQDYGKIYFTRNIARASWKAYRAADVDSPGTFSAYMTKLSIGIFRVIKRYVLLPDELLFWLLWVIPKCREVMKKERPDLIFAMAPPYSSLLIGVFIKKMFKIPLVCDVRDDWVGNPLTQRNSRLLNSIEAKMEKWIVKNSNKIVVVTDASYRLWLKRYPDNKDKICVVHNGYNEQEFNAAAEHKYADFSLVHVGSMDADRSPEIIYKSLAKLGSMSHSISFYHYGLAFQEYKEMAAAYGIEKNVHFREIIPGDEAIAKIKGASVLVLLPTQNAPSAIPGKAYEYLRSGRPILLVSGENATTAFMKGFPNVFHVTPDEVDKCIEVIKGLYDKRDQMTTVTDFPELKNYERKELTGKLARVFNTII
jgi:glycosyltransferase involved in cell wall biosynthesis